MSEAVPHLSLVIPAYCEENRLPDTLSRLTEYAKDWDFDYEVLVVVEKSSDNTLEVAQEASETNPRIVPIDNKIQRGKGYAIRSGVLKARGDIVLSMDADLSVPPEHIDAFLQAFAEHPEVDVIIGNRKHPDSVIEKHQGPFREMLGNSFNVILRTLAMTETRDTQCGFKAMRRRAAQAVYSRQKIDGFACDVETLLLAERMGYEIMDMPVHWINSEESKVRIVRDSFAMLRDTIRTRRLVAQTLAETPPDKELSKQTSKAKTANTQ